MQVRKTINIFITLMLLTAGLPVYQPGDSNGDGRVALEDAILNLKILARSVEQPINFLSSAANAVVAMQTAAGLNTVITGFVRDASGKVSSGADVPGLPFCYTGVQMTPWKHYVSDSTARFFSYITPPIPRPPHRT